MSSDVVTCAICDGTILIITDGKLRTDILERFQKDDKDNNKIILH